MSFEGPDLYSRAGGLASRVEGLAESLASLGFDTHLWFVGDPELPGYEAKDSLHLHRWCQWVSRYHTGGVYDGENGKCIEYSASLPSYLVNQYLLPHARAGGRSVVLAEEWQTAESVLNLHGLASRAGIRDKITMFWNANNTFGFENIAWDQLESAARITTVSRYMKYRMREIDVDALVIPNGLSADAFEPPGRNAVAALRRRFKDRTVLAKMARWDPDKRWLATVNIVSEMKSQQWRPLLIARGGSEPHGDEVLRAAHARGLRVEDRTCRLPGSAGLLEALSDIGQVDVVNLRSHVDPDARRALFRAADAVLANSGHEPFGLVGLETMAAAGVACTGCSGEDYAVPGQNALVLETEHPGEFIGLFRALEQKPELAHRMRRAGQNTAQRYRWNEVMETVLLPRVELAQVAG